MSFLNVLSYRGDSWNLQQSFKRSEFEYFLMIFSNIKKTLKPSLTLILRKKTRSHMFLCHKIAQNLTNKIIRNENQNRTEFNRLTDFTSMLLSFDLVMEDYKLFVNFLEKESQRSRFESLILKNLNDSLT